MSETKNLPTVGYEGELAVHTLAAKMDEDPSKQFFHPMLPIELVMGAMKPREVFESYGIGRDEAAALTQTPAFQAAFNKAQESAKQEGWSFRMRALMQSTELLNTSWRLIHSPETPPNVKKDLILGTFRAAGVQEPEQKGDTKPTFAIQINLG